jgi:hypothetical protein
MILLDCYINLIRTSNIFLSDYAMSVIYNINNLITSKNYCLVDLSTDTIHTVLIDKSFTSIRIINRSGKRLHELVPNSTKNRTLKNIYDILIKNITKNSVLILSQMGGSIVSIEDLMIVCNKSYKKFIKNFIMYNSLDKFYIRSSVGYYEYNNVIYFNMINCIKQDTYRLVSWSTSGINFFNESVIRYLIKDPRWNIKSYEITSDFIEYMAIYKFIIKYLSKNTEEFWDFSKVVEEKKNLTKFVPYLLSKKGLIVKKKECLILRDGKIEVEPFTQDYSCIEIVNHYLVHLYNMPVHEKNLFILMYYSISIRDEYIVLLYNIISSSDYFKYFLVTSLLYLLDVLEYEDIHKYSDIVKKDHKQVHCLWDVPKDSPAYELVHKIKKNMPEKDSPLKMLFIYLVYGNIGEQLLLNKGNSSFLKYIHILLRNLPNEVFSSGLLDEASFKSESRYADVNPEDLYGKSFYFRILSNFSVLQDIIDEFINNQLFVINNVLLKNAHFDFNGPPHLSRMTLEENKKRLDQWK